MSAIIFLIWSNKHEAWWRPEALGYTEDINKAGRYTETEAVRYALDSAMSGRRDQVSYAVAAPENWSKAA